MGRNPLEKWPARFKVSGFGFSPTTTSAIPKVKALITNSNAANSHNHLDPVSLHFLIASTSLVRLPVAGGGIIGDDRDAIYQ
ncbi:hypothetical protein Nepgr_027486 [Nepenthes gracilis]|uniref:Uncharacterized protein n=1 Tax=Nepenthes gracilis TaxID=150966 RepID=A0AAD3TAH2_NEPGR|nr:hypothetical protein Nepgr_027486 [Nepenthes gracilis]